MNRQPAPAKPRHQLLVWFRKWHAWGGLIAALFLLVVGSTGVLLNYKRPILVALGVEPRQEAPRAKSRTPDQPTPAMTGFNTTTGLGASGLTPAEALTLARQHLGEIDLDRIELKREAESLVWKIKAVDEREILVDAATGATLFKGRYQKVTAKDTRGGSQRSIDWGRIALDLHTGRIGGEAGKAFMTAVAGVLIFLSLSGVYMYAKPALLRRRSARARQATPVASTALTPASQAPAFAVQGESAGVTRL